MLCAKIHALFRILAVIQERNLLRSRSHVFFVRDFVEVTHFLILEEKFAKKLFVAI